MPVKISLTQALTGAALISLTVLSASCARRKEQERNFVVGSCIVDGEKINHAWSKVTYRDKIKLAMAQEIYLRQQNVGVPLSFQFRIDPAQERVLVSDPNEPGSELEPALIFEGQRIRFAKLNYSTTTYDQKADTCTDSGKPPVIHPVGRIAQRLLRWGGGRPRPQVPV